MLFGLGKNKTKANQRRATQEVLALVATSVSNRRALVESLESAILEKKGVLQRASTSCSMALPFVLVAMPAAMQSLGWVRNASSRKRRRCCRSQSAATPRVAVAFMRHFDERRDNLRRVVDVGMPVRSHPKKNAKGTVAVLPTVDSPVSLRHS